MKTVKTVFKIMTMALLPLMIFSCSDNDDPNVQEDAITPEEAVLLVENSLDEESGGSIETMVELTVIIEVAIEDAACGSTYEDSIAYDYDQNSIDASYTGGWSYQLQCNAESAFTSSSFSYDTVATVNTPRITASGSSSMLGSIEGLDPEVEDITLTGSYQGAYTQELTISGKNVNSKLTIDLSSLTINKETDTVSSGEGSFTLTGTANKSSFSYAGTITFNANGSASVIIDGETHIILS